MLRKEHGWRKSPLVGGFLFASKMENMNNKEEVENRSEPNFVIVEQPDVPAFLTGKKREEYLKALEAEKIKKIDTSKDEEYKVTMFTFWKEGRRKAGKPLTPEEERYYDGLRNKHEWHNILVVILPMAILITLQKSGVAFGESLVICLGVGAIVKILLVVFDKIKK